MGEQEPKKAKKYICAGVLAHVDAGKTTLSERILYLTGKIRKMGRVDSGDTYLDTDEMERARGITIFSKQAIFSLGETSVTLLDTPGHVDFSAEMERAMQVIDCAILVISGADGVQGHTETLWRLLGRYQIPCFLFINKMDQEGTVRERLMEELKNRLNENCVDFGGDRQLLMENLAMCEEELLEDYLECGTIEEAQIRRLITERKVFPCYFGSALKGDGVEEFLTSLEKLMPCPQYGEEFGAKVFKISRDDQGNRLTHMKITGGCLKVKEILQGKEAEKVNQIRVYSGVKFEPAACAEAGMVCAVVGPMTTYPGQGLGREVQSQMPVLEPVLNYRIELPEGGDIHKMMKNLQQLEEEEPQLHVLWDEDLQEIHVQIMGEVQIDLLKSVIKERFGVDAEFGTGNIVYKETILRPVEGVGHFEPLRHYAEVHLLMEPAEQGSGLQFDTCCSEDVLDRNWQRLVLTHLEEKIHKGILIGAEITDMRIRLVSGRAHIKHTEGGDFRQATYRAVRQGLMEAGCRLLEPYYAFRLEVPQESVGRAMADLERMQGRFEPPQIEGGRAVLTGSGPVAKMRDYQREVVKYTRGRGIFSCVLEGYKPCHNEEEVVAAAGYDPEADLDNPVGSVFCAHGAGFVVPWNEVKAYMHGESLCVSDAQVPEAQVQDVQIPEAQVPNAPKTVARKEYPQRQAPRTAALTSAFGAEEKELEEIFIRTYGEQKPRRFGETGARQVVYKEESARRQEDVAQRQEGTGGHATDKQKEEPGYLLVDGYNIIYAWEELRELAERTIDGARYRLMDILCNYQSFLCRELIVVFDAYKVPGNSGSTMDYHNIHVVYTKEAETADQYIEKFAHQMGRKTPVTVATSDGLEQLIIRGQGCLLMSAKDLREDVERVDRQIKEQQHKLLQPEKYSLFDGVDQELARYLEDVRLGKISLSHQ